MEFEILVHPRFVHSRGTDQDYSRDGPRAKRPAEGRQRTFRFQTRRHKYRYHCYHTIYRVHSSLPSYSSYLFQLHNSDFGSVSGVFPPTTFSSRHTSRFNIMLREIPTMHVTVLKEIAKAPTKYVSEARLKKAFAIGPRKQLAEQFDLAQVLVDYITEAGRLTDDVLPPSLFKAGRTTLSLKNSKISGKYIKKIIDNVYGQLLSLDVSGTFQVDDNTVQYILKSCTELKTLSIRNCRKITDKSLEYIIQYGNNLTSIDLGGCINMSYEGINKFVQHRKMSHLLELNLSGLPIQSDTLSLITTCCVHLTSLGIGYSDIGEMALRLVT